MAEDQPRGAGQTGELTEPRIASHEQDLGEATFLLAGVRLEVDERGADEARGIAISRRVRLPGPRGPNAHQPEMAGDDRQDGGKMGQ
jgi:hypothetical protein